MAARTSGCDQRHRRLHPLSQLDRDNLKAGGGHPQRRADRRARCSHGAGARLSQILHGQHRFGSAGGRSARDPADKPMRRPAQALAAAQVARASRPVARRSGLGSLNLLLGEPGSGAVDRAHRAPLGWRPTAAWPPPRRSPGERAPARPEIKRVAWARTRSPAGRLARSPRPLSPPTPSAPCRCRRSHHRP